MRRIAGVLCLLLIAASCGGDESESSATMIDAPDDFAAEFARGSDDGAYVFYALADDIPDWDSIARAGVFICSEDRPPLIPQIVRDNLDADGFPPGTQLQIAGDSVMAEGSEQTLAEAVGVSRLIVTVPAAVTGCTTVALEEMTAESGMLLMTDADASFPEEGQLANVVLE